MDLDSDLDFGGVDYLGEYATAITNDSRPDSRRSEQ